MFLKVSSELSITWVSSKSEHLVNLRAPLKEYSIVSFENFDIISKTSFAIVLPIREPKFSFTFAKRKRKSKKLLKWNESECQKWKICENETKAKINSWKWYESEKNKKSLFSPKNLNLILKFTNFKYLIQLNIKRDVFVIYFIKTMQSNYTKKYFV